MQDDIKRLIRNHFSFAKPDFVNEYAVVFEDGLKQSGIDRDVLLQALKAHSVSETMPNVVAVIATAKEIIADAKRKRDAVKPEAINDKASPKQAAEFFKKFKSRGKDAIA